MDKIAILGSGTAGLGASHELVKNGLKPIVFEKNDHYGGNAASFKRDGFLFDKGPHISFTKNEMVQLLWAESVKNKYNTLKVEVNNYWKGHWIKHPAQVNLNGLPIDFVVDIVDEIIQAKEGKSLGKLVSELVLFALNARNTESTQRPPRLQWTAKRMVARVDLADRDAVHDALLERTDQ